ncbi:MAG TPA: hypothetical protein VK641_03885 [Terriglobales bacterium]|nr:hypothetical protein [Terriglobales bacterium]
MPAFKLPTYSQVIGKSEVNSIDRVAVLKRSDFVGTMPPWDMKYNLDLITAVFTYVRWLGDHKGISEKMKTRDKVIVDRQGNLIEWVDR